MTVGANTLRLLMEAGIHGEDLIEIVESIEADNAPKQSSGAARQARYRARKNAEKAASDVTSDVTDGVTQASLPRARVEETQKPKSKTTGKNNRKPTPRAELESVLDSEHAAAVIEHRQRLRKPLTPRAASLLAKSLSQARDPNAAADVMIERGWIGFKPEWLENCNGGRAPPSNGIAEAFEEVRRELGIEDEPDSPTTIDITASA